MRQGSGHSTSGRSERWAGSISRALLAALAAALLGALAPGAPAPAARAGGAMLEVTPHEIMVLTSSASGKVTVKWDGGGDKGYVKVRKGQGAWQATGLSGGSGTKPYSLKCCGDYMFGLFDGNGGLLAELQPVKVWTFVPLDTVVNVGCSSTCVGVAPEPHGTFATLALTFGESVGFTVHLSEDGAVGSDGFYKQIAGFPILHPGKTTGTTVNYMNLKPDTQYHYMVTTKDSSGTYGKKTGTLTTKKRRIKVTFDDIKIVDDSDDLSAGDLVFELWVNGQGGSNGRGKFWPSDPGDDWATTGETVHPNTSITVNDAPETLKIELKAWDDDDDPNFGSPGYAGQVAPGVGPEDYETSYGSTTETISAKGLGEEFSSDFAFSAYGSSLKVKVWGTYSVSYH
jgi:hypothetical protein